MSTLRPTACLAVLVGLLASSANADAATPVAIGTGSDPVVAINPDGSANIVYEAAAQPGEQPSSGVLVYCLLPHGAGACAKTIRLTAPGATSALSLGDVFVDGTAVTVYASTQCGGTTEGVERWSFATTSSSATGTCVTSSTGAANLSNGAGFLTSNGLYLDGAGESFPDLFHAISSASGSYATGGVELTDESLHWYEAGVGENVNGAGTDLVMSSRPLANGADVTLAIYKPTAAGASQAALQTASNWATNIDATGTADADEVTEVLSGSGLPYALATLEPVGARHHIALIEAQRTPTPAFVDTELYDGGASDGDLTDADGVRDSTGFELTWLSQGRLRYARSVDNASHTSAPITLQGTITTALGGGYRHHHLATDAAGTGDAVWDDGADQSPTVYAVPLEGAPDALDNPTPTPTPITTPGTGTGAPKTPPSVPPAGGTTKPKAPASAQKTAVATIKDGTFSLGVPRLCVAKGQSFAVTLAFKRKKRKGSKFVKVARVDFSIAGQKVKTDKRAPFRQTLTVTPRASRSVTVRARATIKVRHGRSPKKSIKATVAVC